MWICHPVHLSLILFIPLVHSIGPLTWIGGAALSAGAYRFFKCKYDECCQDPWIRRSSAGLQSLQQNISDQLYGQPFAKKIVYKAIHSHVTNEEPFKPLVMSFHGGPGTGKNHICEIVARGLFQKGARSSYYNRISAVEYFPERDSRSIRRYREQLKDMIESKLKECRYQFFVIDEIDKIAPGILDVLTPFFDYHTGSAAVDARYSIFVFLSNTGSTQITGVLYEAWKIGQNRNDLSMKDLEKLINLSAFNEKGGFRGGDIMARSMIDHFVPFLPLERKHVKRCIEDFVRGKYLTSRNNEFLESVANELEYYPADTQVFSRTGCKRVHAKVDVLWND